jgi:ubiquinone/menaquinone biosynthesis C-methylase UbiE
MDRRYLDVVSHYEPCLQRHSETHFGVHYPRERTQEFAGTSRAMKIRVLSLTYKPHLPSPSDKMFTKSAEFYDALYHFKDYAAAAKQLRTLIQQTCPGATTLLDVGCGTGQHLQHLRGHYQVEGLDLNAKLLKIARQRCPGILFHEGNMVDFNLDRSFDVVTCLFSSIGYVGTIDNLAQAVASMSRHLKPGGILFVEPWFSPENYWTGRLTANFVDQPELKIAWMYLSELKGRTSILDIHYLVGTPQGVDHFTERHEAGLFAYAEYLEAFRRCGLDVRHDPTGLFGRGMYIGVDQRPRNSSELVRFGKKEISR